MSRSQSDFDAALRDALAIRSAYYDLLDLIDSWDHLRFSEACEFLNGTVELAPIIGERLDAVVGMCVSEHYSRLPDNLDLEQPGIVHEATDKQYRVDA